MSALRALTRTRAPRLARPSTSTAVRTFYASALRKEQYLDADAQTFEAVTSKTNDKVVLVDFYADWCGPCKMLSPLLEKITSEADLETGSGKAVDLVTVDIDAHQELAQQFQVRSIPMVVAFQDGKPVSQFVGAMPEGSVRNFLKTL